MEGQRKGWFARIASREDALKVVKDCSGAFFVVAALQAALSFLVGFAVLFDAALCAIGAVLLRRFHSRAAAVVLLLIALVGVLVTAANAAGGKLGGGTNIVLSLIVLWAAIRAVEATFKLNGRYAAEIAGPPPG